MTVILALKGSDHAVLASDTLEMRGPSEGMYRQTAHKIQRVNGAWAVGVSGSLDGLQVVRDFGEERIDGLSETLAVEDLSNRMLDAYKKKGFSNETWFLLVGIKENGRPFIWDWRFLSEEGEVRIEGPREQNSGAIGACNHGALYFVKEFQRETMSVEQNVLLAFHCVAEVAKHDVRVARPIDIAVVRKSGVTRYAESQLSEFVQRSDKITATISEWLSSSDLRLP
jgi:20S proteasome alpha/beta subunit